MTYFLSSYSCLATYGGIKLKTVVYWLLTHKNLGGQPKEVPRKEFCFYKAKKKLIFHFFLFCRIHILILLTAIIVAFTSGLSNLLS